MINDEELSRLLRRKLREGDPKAFDEFAEATDDLAQDVLIDYGRLVCDLVVKEMPLLADMDVATVIRRAAKIGSKALMVALSVKKEMDGFKDAARYMKKQEGGE